MEILDGKKVANEVKLHVKSEVELLKQNGISTKLVAISIGDNKAFNTYLKNKEKACLEVGIEYEIIKLDEKINQKELLDTIEKVNKREDINGILLQSPIPKHLDINQAFSAIEPTKDVDGFNPVNMGKLMMGQDTFIPCTAAGIMKILEHYNIKIEGKNCVIVGRSNLVGKPVMKCLLDKNATVTICHSKTNNLLEFTRNADVLVVATGNEKLITENMVKDGAVVIDVGINWSKKGKLVGDVDYENVASKCSYITPVPGGVGPMTVAMLVNNVLKATKIQI